MKQVVSDSLPLVDCKSSADDQSVIPIFIGYFVSYQIFRHYATDSIDVVNNLILQQALLAYSLISPTIPCLKGFLGRFETAELTRLSEGDSVTTYGLGSRTRVQSVALSTMESCGPRAKTTKENPALAPKNVQHPTRAYAESSHCGDSDSIISFGSQQSFCNRRVAIDAQTLAAPDL